MNGANVDSTDAQLTTARARLASCREEIRRLRSMRRRRAWTRGRMNGELKLVLPLLRLREQIPDVFWRTFVLIIGTSLFVAIAFLATRQSASTATAVTATAVVATRTLVPVEVRVSMPAGLCMRARRRRVREHIYSLEG